MGLFVSLVVVSTLMSDMEAEVLVVAVANAGVVGVVVVVVGVVVVAAVVVDVVVGFVVGGSSNILKLDLDPPVVLRDQGEGLLKPHSSPSVASVCVHN